VDMTRASSRRCQLFDHSQQLELLGCTSADYVPTGAPGLLELLETQAIPLLQSTSQAGKLLAMRQVQGNLWTLLCPSGDPWDWL